MKKIFSAAFFILSAVIYCGCANKTEKADNSGVYETTSVQTETETASAGITPAESIVPDFSASSSPSPYIKDYAGVMNDQTIDACSQVICELNSSRMINAAVVTVSSLGGTDPYEYAAQRYAEIFGNDKNRGLLFLINNDTNEDILYKTGTVTIDSEEEKNALFLATRDIVAGDYSSAAVRMLRLGESCTSHIFDQAGLFSAEQIAELEKAAAHYSSEMSICTVQNIEASDSAESLCKKRYPEKNGIMMLVGSDGKTTVWSESAIPDELRSAAPKPPVTNSSGLYEFLLDLLTAKGGA